MMCFAPEEFVALLEAGGLDAATADQARHLQECSDCREAWGEIAAAGEVLQGVGPGRARKESIFVRKAHFFGVLTMAASLLMCFVVLWTILVAPTPAIQPAGPGQQQEVVEETLKGLIDEFASEDIGRREAAEGAIKKMGSGILPRLRKELADRTDEEVRSRLHSVIDALCVQKTAVERDRNEAVFAREGAALREKHRGKWVAIVDGKVLAPFESFEAASRAVDAEDPQAAHAFVYQAGVEDGDVKRTLRLSPDNFLEIGPAFMKRVGVKTEPTSMFPPRCIWRRGGKAIGFIYGEGVPAEIAPALMKDAKRNGRFETAPLDDEFAHDLTLTEEFVTALRLDRFSVPGKATFERSKIAVVSRKVRCRFIIPELDVDEPAVACVVPEELMAENFNRNLNEDMFRQVGAALREEHHGKWVAIVAGKALAPFDSFDAAARAVNAHDPKAKHAFVYQAGIEDGDVLLPGDPTTKDGRLQIGMAFAHRDGGTLNFGLENATWNVNDNTITWSRSEKLRIGIGCAWSDRATKEADFVVNSQFLHDLTLTEDLVTALGLHRFEVPGKVILLGSFVWRKVRCRVVIPELHVDEPAIAFVVPRWMK